MDRVTWRVWALLVFKTAAILLLVFATSAEPASGDAVVRVFREIVEVEFPEGSSTIGEEGCGEISSYAETCRNNVGVWIIAPTEVDTPAGQRQVTEITRCIGTTGTVQIDGEYGPGYFGVACQYGG